MKLPPPVPLNRRRSGGGWLLAVLLGGLLSVATVRGDVVVTNCVEAELAAAVTAGGLVAFSGSCNLTLTAPINIATGQPAATAAHTSVNESPGSAGRHR